MNEKIELKLGCTVDCRIGDSIKSYLLVEDFDSIQKKTVFRLLNLKANAMMSCKLQGNLEDGTLYQSIVIEINKLHAPDEIEFNL